MEEVLKPDLCVIGAGSGGLSVAAAAAQFGVPVVLIEKGRMGGDCLNYGCVPSKALLAAGKRAEAVRTASNFGIDVIEAQIDHRGVHDHVHGVIAAIAPNDSVERMTGLGVRVIQAQRKLPRQVTVQAGRVLVRARRFVIATGSSPLIPPIPGLDGVPYFTNETIFDVSERIQHLIVIGGGPIGLELGQAHRMLGCHVTVLEAVSRSPRRIPKRPRVWSRSSARRRRARSRSALVERVERRGSGIDVHISEDGEPTIVQGTHLLVATGRKPNVKSLSLDRAEHQVRQARHPGEQGPRDLELARVCHRRRDRRPAIHPRRQLSRRHRHARALFRLPARRRRRYHSLGDLHRSRACPGRAHRGRGE